MSQFIYDRGKIKYNQHTEDQSPIKKFHAVLVLELQPKQLLKFDNLEIFKELKEKNLQKQKNLKYVDLNQ